MRRVIVLIAVILAAPLTAFGVDEKKEARGLVLSASVQFVVLSPAGSATSASTSKVKFRVEVTPFLENRGDTVISLPTLPEHVGGWSDETSRSFSYDFSSPESKGSKRILVKPPGLFQPVTLRPGESVQLPTSSEVQERDGSRLDYYVAYRVEETVAVRHGWWHGALLVKAEPES